MDSEFIRVLNSSGIPWGTLIALLVAGAGILTSIYHSIKKYNTAISNLAIKNKEQDEINASVANLASAVETLKNKIEEMDERRDDQQEQLNKKLDEIYLSMEKSRKDSDERDNELQKRLENNENAITDVNQKLDTVNQHTMLLLDSDKEGIKTTITNAYYEAVHKKYIEIYILQSLEALYEKYLAENGNTFIADLMKELRRLPHRPPGITKVDESE